MSCFKAAFFTASKSETSRSRLVAILDVPAFPGATKSEEQRVLCAIL
jgi:hypothetical protein